MTLPHTVTVWKVLLCLLGVTAANIKQTEQNFYRILWTIRHTLIFKQFLKKNIFTIFIIRLQSQTKKVLSL